MISLRIDRDISVDKDGFCYDIDFRADCECGRKLKAKHSFPNESLIFMCSKCNKCYEFNVSKGKK